MEIEFLEHLKRAIDRCRRWLAWNVILGEGPRAALGQCRETESGASGSAHQVASRETGVPLLPR
jgi:hypothetical protein